MKKLKSKKGFTLTETLISVFLLGVVSLIVTVMMTVILDSSVTMREVAQAEILGSEALDNLQGQLRVAQNITVTTGQDGAQVVTFSIDDDNIGYMFGLDDGKIILGKPDGESDKFFGGVSYGNLSVSVLKFEGDKDEQTIKISVEISSGEKTLWKGNVTVKPLNGITVV